MNDKRTHPQFSGKITGPIARQASSAPAPAEARDENGMTREEYARLKIAGARMVALELRNERKRIYVNPAYVTLVSELKDEEDVSGKKIVMGACIVTLHNGASFIVKGTPGDIASLVGPVSGF